MCLCDNICMNAKAKIRLYFFIEVLIWLLVITIGVGVYKYNAAKSQKELKTYQLFLQDVDGLIVGSPVRMMGVPVGYISNIKVVQDYVYVKFAITQENFNIPKGAIATVEFNGMGGSKSLELYPPDEISKAEGNLIAIKQTNRLSSALGLLDDMFDKLGSIMVRCETFNDGLAGIMPAAKNISQNPVKDTDVSVNQIGNLVERLNNKRLDIKNKMENLPYGQNKD